MTGRTPSAQEEAPQIDEFGTAARVLGSARAARPVIQAAGLLGLACVVVEAVGPSFVIPLARIATGEDTDFAVPVTERPLRSREARAQPT